jgi:long-chain acyl-CoA synthetase
MLEIEGAAEGTGLYYTLINTYLQPDEVAYIIANSRSRFLFSLRACRLAAEAPQPGSAVSRRSLRERGRRVPARRHIGRDGAL